MAQFNDLRQMSTSGINAFQQGQASRGKQTANRLAEIQLANEPTRIKQNNRLADIKLDQAENAPAEAKANAKREMAAKFAQGVASKMANATPEEQQQIFDSGQQALNQFFVQQGLSTPEEAAGEVASLDQFGGAQGFISAFSETVKPAKDTTLIQNAKAAGIMPGTPEFKEYLIAQGKGGTTNINVNNAPLTKSTTNQVQKDLIGEEALLADLETIKPGGSNYFDPEQLTLQGRGETKIAEWMDAVGMSSDGQKERLTKWTQFSNQVSQVFNQYRKEITGAAASVQELEQLKQSLINKDQTTTQFRAAYEQFTSKLERAINAKQKLLTQGIDLSSDDGAALLDKEIRNQEAAAGENIVISNDAFGDVTEADIQFTMQENGLTREEVMERLNAP